MARGHGRILASIWEDEDFIALDEGEQRMYQFLLSQPNLNHAGLLPMTLRRWARKARGLTVGTLESRLDALEARRFTVMDTDTEELLIRSFVRNDGVWKQPKVMGAMVSGAQEISSRKLRLALLAEMDRIPLDDLSDEPTKVRNVPGPSIRQQVVEHIEALRKAFEGLDPTPPGTGPQGGYEGPSLSPSASPSDTPGDEGREGSTRAGAIAHVPAQTHAAPAPAPSPASVPCHEKEGVAEVLHMSTMRARQAEAPAPIDDDGFELTDALRRYAHATYPSLNVDYEYGQFLNHHRSRMSRRRNWYADFQSWLGRSAKWESERAQQGLRPSSRSGYQHGHINDEADYQNQQEL